MQDSHVVTARPCCRCCCSRRRCTRRRCARLQSGCATSPSGSTRRRAPAPSCHVPGFSPTLSYYPNKPLARVQGREAVPDTVDHVQVRVDPREDRSWLQAEPRVPTDNAHAHDAVGPQHDTPENWSEAAQAPQAARAAAAAGHAQVRAHFHPKIMSSPFLCHLRRKAAAGRPSSLLPHIHQGHVGVVSIAASSSHAPPRHWHPCVCSSPAPCCAHP